MRILLLALALLLAGEAQAVNSWGTTIRSESAGAEIATDCQGGNSVGGAGKICFDFDANLSPAAASFNVTAPSALACMRPDWQVQGVPGTASPAQATIHYASSGDVSSDANAGIHVCPTAGCPLDGLNGAPAVQKVCVTLGPGAYRVSFGALPDGTDVGLFTVQGGF